MKIKTSTGFKCDIDTRLLKDYRFVKAVTRTKSKDPLEASGAIFEITELLLGDDTALVEHCTTDGIADIESVSAEITEIIAKLGENKEIKK